MYTGYPEEMYVEKVFDVFGERILMRIYPGSVTCKKTYNKKTAFGAWMIGSTLILRDDTPLTVLGGMVVEKQYESSKWGQRYIMCANTTDSEKKIIMVPPENVRDISRPDLTRQLPWWFEEFHVYMARLIMGEAKENVSA